MANGGDVVHGIELPGGDVHNQFVGGVIGKREPSGREGAALVDLCAASCCSAAGMAGMTRWGRRVPHGINRSSGR